jgi:hypothetical protein
VERGAREVGLVRRGGWPVAALTCGSGHERSQGERLYGFVAREAGVEWVRRPSWSPPTAHRCAHSLQPPYHQPKGMPSARPELFQLSRTVSGPPDRE